MVTAQDAVSDQTTGGSDCADNWVSIDGKAFFQRAATAGQSQGTMGLTATDETDADAFKQFRSKEASSSGQVPYADVEYNAWSSVTARATVPATDCVTGGDRPLVNTLTPQLRATVADADAASLAVTFEWWAVDGTQALGSATVTVAPGATASTAVPAGALADGGSYRWRVLASDGVEGSSTWSSFCEMTVYVTAPPAAGCPGGTAIPGDFNGDGVRDLAIADPEATVGGRAQAGALRVVDGATGAVRTLAEGATGVGGVAAAGERFGTAVAAYDVNRDGCGDLAVGAPYEDVAGATDAGTVFVLLGSPSGLAGGPAALQLAQGRNGTPETPEAGDWFGASLAAGQTAAGESYLVAGAPGEDLGSAVDTGVVHYWRGAVNAVLDQSVSGANETDDRFGTSVAGSPWHIAAGRPGEEINGATFAGAVSVFGHTLAGNGAPAYFAEVEQSPGMVEVAQTGDMMGTSVALAPYRSSATATGESLLVVGVPGEDVPLGNGQDMVDAGTVQRYLVTPTGVTKQADITEATPDVAGEMADGDYFGQRVLVTNLAPDQVSTAANIKIVVGAPGEDGAAGPDTGLVQVFDAGTAPGDTDVVIQRGAGLPGTAATGDLIGISLMADAGSLYLASPYGEPGVVALAWSDLAAGTVSPVGRWQPGVAGIPDDFRAFGAAMG